MPANTTLGLLLEAKTTGQQDLDKLTDALNKFTGAAENSAKRTEDANKKASDSTKHYADTIKSALSEPFATASQQAEKFALSLGKIGGITVGAVGGMVALGLGAFELTKHYAEAAKQTINFSERLGITITQAQKLGAQARLSGVDIGVLESSTRILATALEDSTGSGAKAYKALLQLGVASRTSSGESRELGQVMIDVIEKLSKLDDVTKRTALGAAILGRSSKEIQPLIEEYQKTKEAVDALGVGISANGTRKLAELHEQLTKTEIAFDIFKKKIAEGITPIIIPVLLNFNSGGVAGVLRGLDALTPAGIISKRLGLGRGKGDDFPFKSQTTPITLSGIDLEKSFADQQADVAAGAASVAGFQKRFQSGSPEFITSQLEQNKSKIKELQGILLDPNVGKAAKDAKDTELRALDLENQKLEQRLKLIQNAKKAEEELLHLRQTVAAKTSETGVLARFGADVSLFQRGVLSPESLTPARKQFLQFATQPGVTEGQQRQAAGILQPQIAQENIEALKRFQAVGKKAQEDELKNLPEFYKALFGIRDEKNLNQILEERQKAREAQFKFDISEDSPKNRARAASQPIFEQSLALDQTLSQGRATAGIRLAAIRGGPENQLAIIAATLKAGKDAADEKNRWEVDLLTAKYKYDGTLEDRLQEQRLKHALELQDIEIQAVEKVAELQKQRTDENKQFAGSLFDAITGGTTKQFLSGILHNTGRTAFENVFSSTLNGGRFQIPGQGTSDNPNILGKLLKGTPFGIDPLKNGPLDANTSATNALTAAMDTIIQLMGGTVPAGANVPGISSSGVSSVPLSFGGFNIAGLTSSGGAFEQGIGSLLNIGKSGASNPTSILGSVLGLAKIFSGSGLSNSTLNPGGIGNVYQSDPNNPYSSAGVAAPQSVRAGSRGIAGPLFDPNSTDAQKAGSAIASVGTLYAGVQDALHNFKQGGAQGAIGGIGSIAGTALAFDFDPTGISQAVLGGVALGSKIITSIIGDPKVNRQNLINKRLFNDQFAAATSVNVTESTGGSYVANDRFGNIQTTDLSPYPSVQEPFLDPSNKVNVPGRTTLPYGGSAAPVTIIYAPTVPALDGPSVKRVLDTHAPIMMDAIATALNRGHGQGVLNVLSQRGR
ncbi:MAG TPA: hypothetical protein VNV82_17820 [Bryobacteraceae bacterium]|jgi:hypothetical protein|nr:hypothetical protein [Bryobacteraceae bacterium]